jgi:hypothetical protein
MKNSPNTRERFQQIGRDQLALALATGKFQSLGLTEDMKPAAIEGQGRRRQKRQRADRGRFYATEYAALRQDRGMGSDCGCWD